MQVRVKPEKGCVSSFNALCLTAVRQDLSLNQKLTRGRRGQGEERGREGRGRERGGGEGEELSLPVSASNSGFTGMHHAQIFP